MDINKRDAVEIAPHLHTVIFENELIRVLKVVVKPKEKADMHWHPSNMNYILSSGKLRIIKQDSTTVDSVLLSGQVTFSSAGSHIVENIGKTEVQTIQVELKKDY